MKINTGANRGKKYEEAFLPEKGEATGCGSGHTGDR